MPGTTKKSTSITRHNYRKTNTNNNNTAQTNHHLSWPQLTFSLTALVSCGCCHCSFFLAFIFWCGPAINSCVCQVRLLIFILVDTSFTSVISCFMPNFNGTLTIHGRRAVDCGCDTRLFYSAVIGVVVVVIYSQKAHLRSMKMKYKNTILLLLLLLVLPWFFGQCG